MWELEKYDGRTASIDDKGVQATYHDLEAVQQKMAAVIGRRTLVISLCRNSIGSVAGYAALINLRIVPVMLNANLEASLMENLFSIYLPAYIWLPSGCHIGYNHPISNQNPSFAPPEPLDPRLLSRNATIV